MKRLVLAIILVSFPSAAFAQPLGDGTGTETPPPPPPPDPDPAPPPPPPPDLAPAVEPEPDAPPSTGARPIRPEGNTVAIGVGWDLPADVQAPNVTSVRFRHTSGFTIEPQLELSRATTKIDDNMPPDIKVTTTDMVFTVLARMPMITNGKVDFELAGGLGFGRSVINPDMADNDTTTTAFTLGYGLAVAYWFTPHVHLSLTGMNPIFSTSTEVEEMGPTLEVTTTSSSFGLVFQPNVFVMLHLYL